MSIVSNVLHPVRTKPDLPRIKDAGQAAKREKITQSPDRCTSTECLNEGAGFLCLDANR